MLPTVFIIYGATGDLTNRKLIPALFRLYTRGELPKLFHVLGFARGRMSDAEFQEQVRTICVEHAQGKEAGKAEEFSALFTYQTGMFEDIEAYHAVAKRLGRQDTEWRTCANKLFYLAVPPEFYKTIFQHLSESGLTEPCSPEEGWTRVIVEKPFGKDLQTAQELDLMLGKLFQEEQIFRIDHYLGKETARNILAFRFSNTFLQSAWSSRSIASVHVHFPESAGVDRRGEFYDGIGALRDVGQNHMLQLLALFLMEKPESFEAGSIRAERTKVLEALEVLDNQDISSRTVRGQYEGYREVEGVAPDSETETYFRLETRLKAPRWQNMPIYLESGKALDESKFEIVVRFRHETPCLCPPGEHYTNELRYRIQPDEGVYMTFWVKRPGGDMVIEEKEFSFNYHEAFQKEEFVDAYTKLLSDAIAGDQTLFVSTDEISVSWRFIDPIIRAWQEGAVPLTMYAQGTSRSEMAKLMAGPRPVSKQIGYIGLGKMGSNMAERLLDHGWEVIASDPSPVSRDRTARAGAVTFEHAAEVVKKLSAPRTVWLMVPHEAVDGVIDEILPLLEKGDAIIDGGNSFFKDSLRRAETLERQGVDFLDAGVSGGPGGARHGSCLMIGGKAEVYKRYIPLFSDLAVAGGYDYMGKAGAGHFVKMVHNGIEYGMMQAIAEGFTVMKKSELNVERIANLYNHGSVIESSLIGWLKDGYEKYGEDLDGISGEVSHSGEGQWTVETARELGIPVPIIEGALQFRVDSKENPSYTGQTLSALRNMFGGHSVKGDL